MELPDTPDLGDTPLAELLTLISDLFSDPPAGLPADPPAGLPATPPRAGARAAGERARRLRLALGELNERAAKLCHPARTVCSCGQTLATPDELDDHFSDAFVPNDDIGTDGRPHAEIVTEPPS